FFKYLFSSTVRAFGVREARFLFLTDRNFGIIPILSRRRRRVKPTPWKAIYFNLKNRPPFDQHDEHSSFDSAASTQYDKAFHRSPHEAADPLAHRFYSPSLLLRRSQE